LEILSSFLRKEMNTKVEDNFVAHNLDTEFALLESGCGRYGVGKEGLRIRKIWTRLILWKPSLLLSQGVYRARQGGARPKVPQGHKYKPLGAPRGLPIDIQSFYRYHSLENRRCKMRERVG
jgi:hypothetical protein